MHYLENGLGEGYHIYLICSFVFFLQYCINNDFFILLSKIYILYVLFIIGWCKLLLTHWGRVKHICVNKLTIISSDNGLTPGRRQAIIWTNAGILLIGPLATNFSEIVIKI